MNLPNLLSILRLCLAPVFIFVYIGENNPLIAFIILLFSGYTDFLDGYIARKGNLITSLGKILDPLADKITQAVVIASFCYKDILPWWVFAIFFFKEAMMAIYSAIYYNKLRFVVYAKWFGKVATFLIYFFVGVTLLFYPPIPLYIIKGTMIFAVLWSFCSGIAYFITYYNQYKKQFKNNI